jgi:hypothetical protein
MISDGFSYFISKCGGGEMEGVSQKHLKAGDIVVRSAVGYATVELHLLRLGYPTGIATVSLRL